MRKEVVSLKFNLFIALCVAAFCIVAFTGTQILGSQGKTVEDRVANLEIQVSDLTSRVIQLEKQLATSSAQATSVVPVGKVAWRKLQMSMTKSQVRALLGEPEKIENFGLFEIWQYRSNSQVKFDSKGSVTGWREPEKGTE
jgi:hypothetical protein